jgi:hypothetical protein
MYLHSTHAFYVSWTNKQPLNALSFLVSVHYGFSSNCDSFAPTPECLVCCCCCRWRCWSSRAHSACAQIAAAGDKRHVVICFSVSRPLVAASTDGGHYGPNEDNFAASFRPSFAQAEERRIKQPSNSP